MKKRLVGLLLAAMMCVVVACGAEDSGESSGENVESSGMVEESNGAEAVVSVPASNTAEKDGIIVTISTDKSDYAAGEEIHYSIKVENSRDLYVVQKSEFTYKNTDGLKAANSLSMPTSIPQLYYGESYEVRGTLVGDTAVFPVNGDVPQSTYVDEGAFDPYGGTKTGKDELIIKTEETINIRPYVEVNYGGQKVMVRAVMYFDMAVEKGKFSISEFEGSKRTSCHDPSIFKDFDGTYYIFGTHIGMSYTENLKDWTNNDGAFRLSFDTATREAIRAWNKDANAGNWYDYLWAPDVIYNEKMGKYCMYLSANGDDWKSNIVLLTADAAAGPYTYAGSVVYGGFDDSNYTETDVPQVIEGVGLPQRYIDNGVKNRKWGDEFPNCIDPTVFYDDEGNLWMAYGSWSGGIFMLELDEETGLRDYSVKYETNKHSDAYFGTKIAGGKYVSGEGAYIEKIGDYYWLFISYGNLEAKGGYNVRVYRSETPNGGYVDALGNDAYSDKYVFNYNLANKGIRLFGGYRWRTFGNGEVAQGHNSAFVDDDGKAYIVYHTRTTDGSEGHSVRVHQLFLNKEGWLVAAPYQANGEALDASVCTMENVAGKYEVILHDLNIDYKKLEAFLPNAIYLSEDGTVTGHYTGTWSLEEGTSYINLTLDGVTYSGVSLQMKIENLVKETMVFTALGKENQLTLWGSKMNE